MSAPYRCSGHRTSFGLLLLAVVLAHGCTPESKLGGGNPPPGTIPQFQLAPASVTFQYSAGGAFPAPQTVDVTSPTLVTGLTIGTILYSPVTSGWLAADYTTSAPATPAAVTLTATPPPDLTPGTYVAMVPIGSTVAGVTAQAIVATLTIDSIPVIDASPTLVTVSATQGGGNPAAQSVAITNDGAGTLSGLSLGAPIYGTGATNWLITSLSSTTAPATLTLQPVTGALAAGTYIALVPIRSSVPGVAPDTITVSFGVGAVATPPTINLSPASLSVAAISGGVNPPAQTVAVANGGGGILTGLAIGSVTYGSGASGWLTATIASGTAPTTITIQTATASVPVGTYTATVRVTSSVPGVTASTFQVTLSISPQPPAASINLAPSNPTFTLTAGAANPPAISVTVSNGGGGALTGLSLGTTTYGAGATGWLSSALSNTTAPASVTLTVNAAGIVAGTYTATVPVASALPGVATQNVTVALQVNPAVIPPAIGLAPTTMSFAATSGGGSPGAKTATVTNSGGGILTGLAVGTITYTGGNPGWLSATLDQATAPAVLTLMPTTPALPVGSYSATVPVTSGVAGNSPRNVTVNLTVSPPPSITLSPNSLTFTGTTGQPNPSPGTVTITNGGSGTLTGLAIGAIAYGAGQPTGWLSASLSSTTAPATLVVTPTTGALAAGTYTATVPVTSTTPGATSKSVSVSFLVGAPSGALVLLGGDQQTGLVNTTLPVVLKARLLDAASNPRVGVSVVWQANNGGQLSSVTSVTNALGEVSATWTLGPVPGLHTTTVSSAGLPTLTFTADAQSPTSLPLRPNEPAGFTAFAEHNFTGLPTNGQTLGQLLGTWVATVSGNLGIITPDLTAPASSPNMLQTRFPNNLAAGTAPVSMSGWASAGPTFEVKKMYLAVWVKLKLPDYENQSVGTKMGFIGYGPSPFNTARNQGFFLMKGTGSTAVGTAFRMSFEQQGHVSRSLPQNANSSPLMTAGQWHEWELLVELNTLGQADGTLKMWIDGTLILNYSNMVWISTGNTHGFYEYRWNPTWGGIGGAKTRDDFVLIDHAYISGVP